MKDIAPKYEVLYEDLKKHDISDYLVSREFKLFMINKDYFTQWRQIFTDVESSRNYTHLGRDYKLSDSCITLGTYFNELNRHYDENLKI